jgi:DNA-binding beta-propeller fold protein YncE
MISRRRALHHLAALPAAPLALGSTGCVLEAGAKAEGWPVELVWGVHGTREGRLHKPRVAAIDSSDHLYLADLTDRIQVFDRDGKYLRGWRTPGLNVDGPSGLTVDRLGRVLVGDTHFYRVLVYSPQGEILQQIGDGIQGSTPGRFGYATDVVIDTQGNFYVAEYSDFDRIQVFSPEGRFLRQWGGHGYELGQFLRPRAMAIDSDDLLYVADSCNHRIQVFDTAGRLLHYWGRRGVAAGEMSFPYDIALAPDQTLYVCEYGNSRVQRFTRAGESLGVWGGPGRASGMLDGPYALAVDSQGAVHVIDSGNHRVQRFRMPESRGRRLA